MGRFKRVCGALARVLTVALLFQSAGCIWDRWGGDGGGFCDNQVPVATGALVEGNDPKVLLAPFFSSWTGPLVWADDPTGMAPQLTLTVSHQNPETIFSNTCPPSVSSNVDASLSTDDHSLDAPATATVDVNLPNSTASDRGVGLSLDGLGGAPLQGPAAHVQGADRYTDGHLRLSVDWDWTESKPTHGVLSFSGTSKATGQEETFAIATWEAG